MRRVEEPLPKQPSGTEIGVVGATKPTKEDIIDSIYRRYGFSPGADIPPALAEKMQKEIQEQVRAIEGEGQSPTREQSPFEEFPKDERNPAAAPPPQKRWERQLRARQMRFR